jgi:hypothetical protein
MPVTTGESVRLERVNIVFAQKENFTIDKDMLFLQICFVAKN